MLLDLLIGRSSPSGLIMGMTRLVMRVSVRMLRGIALIVSKGISGLRVRAPRAWNYSADSRCGRSGRRY